MMFIRHAAHCQEYRKLFVSVAVIIIVILMPQMNPGKYQSESSNECLSYTQISLGNV